MKKLSMRRSLKKRKRLRKKRRKLKKLNKRPNMSKRRQRLRPRLLSKRLRRLMQLLKPLRKPQQTLQRVSLPRIISRRPRRSLRSTKSHTTRRLLVNQRIMNLGLTLMIPKRGNLPKKWNSLNASKITSAARGSQLLRTTSVALHAQERVLSARKQALITASAAPLARRMTLQRSSARLIWTQPPGKQRSRKQWSSPSARACLDAAVGPALTIASAAQAASLKQIARSIRTQPRGN